MTLKSCTSTPMVPGSSSRARNQASGNHGRPERRENPKSHGTSAKVVKALGGTPVAMPMPELYQALQKGCVDGGVYPMEVNKGWKMADVIDYCTLDLPIAYTSTFYVVMNKDKWNSLPKDVQGHHRKNQPGMDSQTRRGLGPKRRGRQGLFLEKGWQNLSRSHLKKAPNGKRPLHRLSMNMRQTFRKRGCPAKSWSLSRKKRSKNIRSNGFLSTIFASSGSRP